MKLKLILAGALLSLSAFAPTSAYAWHCKVCQCKQGPARYCLGGVNPVAPSCATICESKGGVADGEDAEHSPSMSVQEDDTN